MEIIKHKQLEEALSHEYRQYLTGHLGRPQPYLQHIDDDTEIGMSYYSEFTADTPHVHPICTEYTYILEGSVRIRLLETGEELELNKGDFSLLRPNTPYASKNAADTRVLFIKVPGINDKTLVTPDDGTKRWLQSWDVADECQVNEEYPVDA